MFLNKIIRQYEEKFSGKLFRIKTLKRSMTNKNSGTPWKIKTLGQYLEQKSGTMNTILGH